MSKVLKVSAKGYYSWCKRKPTKRSQENKKIEIAIKAIHRKSRETYGPLRIKDELEEMGFKSGVSKIIRLRKEMGIKCKIKRKYKHTTNSKHNQPVFENILEQNFNVDKPNKIWVSDITYIDTAEGWLYLAGVEDLFNRELVGYSLSTRITKEIVINALNMGIIKRNPKQGLIHHSDRGSQYCSKEFRNQLSNFGIKGSMSRKGNCYDNAAIESFWKTLKTELINHKKYRTRSEAIRDIKEYIEIFYNKQRRHSKLGNVSPDKYLKNYYNNNFQENRSSCLKFAI